MDVSVATLSNTLITAGETVQIALRVENAGERDGTFEKDLIVDGEAVGSESVTVEAGRSEAVVFEHRFDEPGEYEIAVGETSLGTLTVTAASDEETATNRGSGADKRTGSIEVVEATAPADWVREGSETTVRATVVNTANRTINRTLTVTVDEQPVANETVTLQPNERGVVTVEFEAVSGIVAVEGVDAGRIDVSGTRGEVRTDTADTTENTGAGFEIGLGVLFVVAGTLAGAAVHVRRWHR